MFGRLDILRRRGKEKHSKAFTATCSINLSEPSVDGSGKGTEDPEME